MTAGSANRPLTGALLDEVEVGVLATDAGGTIRACSRYLEDLVGASRDSLIGKTLRDVVSPAPGEQPLDNLWRSALAGGSPEAQVLVRPPGGIERHTFVTLHGRRSSDGTWLGAVMFVTPVAQHHRNARRREAERATAAALAQAATLEEAGPTILRAICESLGWDVGQVWLENRERTHLRVVASWQKPRMSSGGFLADSQARTFAPGEGLPGRVWATGRPEWLPDVESLADLPRAPVAQADDLHAVFVIPLRTRLGCYGVLEFFSHEIREPDEDLLRMMATIGTQVGQFLERQRAEEAVRESDARKTAMFEAALDCVVTIDHEGVVLEFNPAAERTFGYSREEAVGRVMAELIVPPHLRRMHLDGVKRSVGGGSPRVLGRRVELPAIRKDGTEFPVELTITKVDVPGPPLFTGYLRDITERKRVEGELSAVKDELAAQLQDMTRLHEISLRLSSSPDLKAVGPEVLAAATELQGAPMGLLMLWDDDRQRLHIAASHQMTPLTTALMNELATTPWFVDCVRNSVRVVVEDTTTDPRLVDRADEAQLAGVRAIFCTPLVTFGGELLGGLATLFGGPHVPSERSIRRIELFARQAAEALQNARLYEHERRTAETLQRSLLPERLPQVAGLETRARYMPGGAGIEVGGDWYDVIPLPRGRVALALGDVVGRGVRAASVMGQMRMALRAYAMEDHPPSEVVARLDRLVQKLDQTYMATLLFLVLNLDTSEMCIVNAGHPPPALRAPDGSVRFIEEGRAVPLGVLGHPSYTEETVPLETGATLLLYSDGLIERRTEPIERGLERLAAALADAPEDLDELCDHVVARMVSEDQAADDVAVLACCTSGVDGDRLELKLLNDPEVLSSVRRLLARWLENVGMDEAARYDVITACGEACANAVEHAYGARRGEFELTGWVSDGSVVLSVRDSGSWRQPRDRNRGRGLGMVDALMDSVEVLRSTGGTEVRMKRRLGAL